MTVVTTSRKPIPSLRTFSKDLAFTLGGTYKPRGKSSVQDILTSDDCVIFCMKERRAFLMQVHLRGEPYLECAINSFDLINREGTLQKGIRSGNREIADALKPHLPVSYDSDVQENHLIFDGLQRRQYVVRLPARA